MESNFKNMNIDGMQVTLWRDIYNPEIEEISRNEWEQSKNQLFIERYESYVRSVKLLNDLMQNMSCTCIVKNIPCKSDKNDILSATQHLLIAFKVKVLEYVWAMNDETVLDGIEDVEWNQSSGMLDVFLIGGAGECIKTFTFEI